MGVIERYVGVGGGVRLHVREWEGAGRAFLLVHGLASNARLWDGVAGNLTGHRVVAVDLRGHGESDQPDGGYDTATAAGDLAELTRAMELGGAVVAGQSWGGNVVVELAAMHPGLAGALALVDGGWLRLSETFTSWEACLAALTPPPVDGVRAADLAGVLRRHHPDWADWAIEATLANLRTAPDGYLTRRLALVHHLAIVRSMWELAPDRYPLIDVPVLLLPAIAADPGRAAGKRAEVARAAELLPHAKIREYVGADHDLHAQHPADLAADLLALA